ncbi:MAG: LysR substrate-binding domain-containing protein [Pseudomonadota bacterium]
MRFHNYDALKLFVMVARHQSLSAAAGHLHLTKGALSHQIKRLEEDLGFAVFTRHARGIELSAKGRELLSTAEPLFDRLESRIERIATSTERTLTIGVTTYFASRWLSPRLTAFMQAHPDVRLRIQPMIDLSNFAGEEVDLAIRWGRGQWTDCEIIPLMWCAAWPTGNREATNLVQQQGLACAFRQFTLLRDREDSNAWSHWFKLAGLSIDTRMDSLIIPDPNVRVQAVLDGQGVALNDELVSNELQRRELFRLSEIELGDYGYHLAYEKSSLQNTVVSAFLEWISHAATAPL